jgi:glycosyltransferase involved in cell wall biosynthesis
LESKGIPYQCLSNLDSTFKRVWQLSRFIKSFGPDAIITFMKVPSMASIIARALSGVKCRLMVSERTALVKPFRDFIHFSIWHFADVITTNSISKVDYFKRNFPFIHRRLHLITNIYDHDVFTEPKETQSKRLSHDFNFIFVGRISPEKNLEILLRSLGKVSSLGYDFSFNIYGDIRNSSYYLRLNNVIDELKLNDKVFFHGPTKPEDLKVIYRHCDLVCLLSEYEGFSNVLAEVLINGSIALTSNIPENAYIIKDNENGFLVRNDDIDSITNGFLRYIRLDRDKRSIIRENNVSRAQVLFNRDRIYEMVIGLLNPK